MIKKITDDIFDNPKDRDTKQKSQEETVTACKCFFSSIFKLVLI